MSGSGAEQRRCSCSKSRCLTGICSCVKASLPCSSACRCYDCQNTKKSPVPYPVSRCTCKKTKCSDSRQCSCLAQHRRCNAKCKCLNCANSEGLSGGDTHDEQQQGSEDSVNNEPDKAVQASPPRDNRGSGSNKRPRNQLSL